jgi:hypothetical protein
MWVPTICLMFGIEAEKRAYDTEAARAGEAENWRRLTVSPVFEDGRFNSREYERVWQN